MVVEQNGKRPNAGRYANMARIMVGCIWLAGAVFNLLVTTRMKEPFQWLEEVPILPYRWFFREVVGERPAVWAVALAVGEIALGVLTLSRRGTVRLGLAGGALFSIFLVSLSTLYTLVMAPYAVFLGWLSRFEYESSPIAKGVAVFGRRA